MPPPSIIQPSLYLRVCSSVRLHLTCSIVVSLVLFQLVYVASVFHSSPTFNIIPVCLLSLFFIFDFGSVFNVFSALKNISPTWGTVYELQVIQGCSSAHIPRANPFKYHLKVPQLPQGDLSSIPLIPLMPCFIPHFQQIVLCLWRRAVMTGDHHVVAFHILLWLHHWGKRQL